MKLKTSPATLGTLAIVLAMSGTAFAFAQSPSAPNTNIPFIGESKEGEAAESARLAPLATVTESQAVYTAQSAYQGQGTMTDIELEDEDGTIVYGIEFTEANGKEVDVKVDAKTGEVVKIEDDSNEHSEEAHIEEKEEESEEHDGVSAQQ